MYKSRDYGGEMEVIELCKMKFTSRKAVYSLIALVTCDTQVTSIATKHVSKKSLPKEKKLPNANF